MQETGRAGQDGAPALYLLLHNNTSRPIERSTIVKMLTLVVTISVITILIVIPIKIILWMFPVCAVTSVQRCALVQCVVLSINLFCIYTLCECT